VLVISTKQQKLLFTNGMKEYLRVEHPF